MNWTLAAFYWVHLTATVIWLGGLALLALIAWPAWRRQTLTDNQWLALQKQFTPWVNGSMIVLWITGFVQMTNDPSYNGFLALDSVWAVSMLLKHGAVLGMMVLGLLVQWRIHPQMERVALLRESKPRLAESEMNDLAGRERALLRWNLACAALVLLFTAVATAA